MKVRKRSAFMVIGARAVLSEGTALASGLLETFIPLGMLYGFLGIRFDGSSTLRWPRKL